LLYSLPFADASGIPEARWEVRAAMSAALRAQGKRDAAIWMAKEAVNVLQEERATLGALDVSLRRSFVCDPDREAAYRDLAELLVEAGRLGETQQVLGLLKREEYRGLVRGGEEPGAADFAGRENAAHALLAPI